MSKKKLLADSSLVFVSTVVKSISALLLSIILFRLSDKADYGYYVLSYATFTVIIGMLSFRTKEAISKYSSVNGNLGYIVNRCLSIDVVMCSGGALLSAVFLYFYGFFYLLEVIPNLLFIAFLALSFLLKFMDPTFFSICRIKSRYVFLIISEVCSFFVLFVFILFSVYLDLYLSLSLISFFLLLQSIFRLLLQLFIIKRITADSDAIKFSFNKELIFSKDEVSNFLKLDYLNTLISIPVKQGDVLILGWFVPIENVGLYKIAKNVLNIILQVSNAVSVVIFQRFVELEHNELKGFLIRFLYFWIPLVALCTLVLYIINPYLIDMLYGEEASYSSYLLNIMLPFFIVTISLFWVWPLILKLGYLKPAIYQSIISGTLFFILSPIMTYFFNAEGMAISNAFIFSFSNVMGLYIIFSNAKKRRGNE